ncbi:hypothetical protein ABMA28_016511 [Loxostege sticticalis]|uniref:Chitin-binding type-2 domain-containing protein n=1 Tax=Loxostege sticticalis TaxID=481309 RepID=A0ABD0T930_LOXSC
MCGDMGKAVLRALTGALLCGLASDAYLQEEQLYQQQAVQRPVRDYKTELLHDRYQLYPYDFQPEPQQVYRKPLREHEKPQDLRNVPGVPGVDFPIYHEVPETSFSCDHVPVRPGMYANVETGCQAYHICHDGREGHQGAALLCTNGTLFNQEKFTCDWWYNVDCSQAVHHYRLNADPLKNPYVPKPKPEEEHGQHGQHAVEHGLFYRHA